MREITDELSNRCGAVDKKKEGLKYLKFENTEYLSFNNFAKQKRMNEY